MGVRKLRESKIEWTDATWNPWTGCDKVSPGCKLCYAGRITESHGGVFFGNVHATKLMQFPTTLAAPHMIFTCSMSDFFHPVADQWRDEAWKIIKQTPQHAYQILMKRPERIYDHLPPDWPYDNVWLGTSVEMNMYYHRVQLLTLIPAKVHFISFEPLLEKIDTDLWLAENRLKDVEWIITGGESDYKNPRPADPQWFRLLRNLSQDLEIPFFHKQNGGRSRCSCHGTWGCRLLDNETYDQFPVKP